MHFNNLTGQLPNTEENYRITTKISYMHGEPIFMAVLNVQITETIWSTRDVCAQSFNYGTVDFSHAAIKQMEKLGSIYDLQLIKSSLTQVA